MDAFAQWWKRPFSTDMTVGGWAIFLLLLFILAGFWKSVISLIKG
jgi:hypothetical protein